MVTSRGISLVVVALSLLFIPLATALKFDISAHANSAKYERCIRNFVSTDTLVVVTAIVSGTKGDGQVVNMHVSNPSGKQVRWDIDMLC